MKDRDLDKELKELLVLKEKLPLSIKQAIEIANSVTDLTSRKNEYTFTNNMEGTNANS